MKSCISFPRIKDLDPRVASSLVSQRRAEVVLEGIEEISVPLAKALRSCSCRVFLHNVNEMSPQVGALLKDRVYLNEAMRAKLDSELITSNKKF
jgi:2-phospho-L-lactate guanylyltransferase (CobY/MobA/RfbA family)